MCGILGPLALLFDFLSFSFELRNLYNYSLETAVAVLFGREVEIQNGVKDEFIQATKVAFKGRETDIPFMVTSSLIQC